MSRTSASSTPGRPSQDRVSDPLFNSAFRETLASAGVETVTLPPRSPNLNAYAQCFVRSVKESCLDRLILVGESPGSPAMASGIEATDLFVSPVQPVLDP